MGDNDVANNNLNNINNNSNNSDNIHDRTATEDAPIRTGERSCLALGGGRRGIINDGRGRTLNASPEPLCLCFTWQGQSTVCEAVRDAQGLGVDGL